MKLLPTLFKPLCNQQPKTTSFRVMSMQDDIYKTINSMYFDRVEQESDWVETPESWFTSSSNSGSLFTTDFDELVNHESYVEAIVLGAQQTSSNNHRLFFDPGESDSPRLLTHKPQHRPFKKSVALSVDSKDPYEDFKSSMEEMVDDLGVKDDWEGLEDLLRWYLKVNGKETHGYIINAFVDLIGNVIGKNNEISTSTSISSDNDGDFDHVVNNDHHREISKSTTFSSAASTLSSLGSNITLDDHMI